MTQEEKETLLGWVKESDTLRLVPHKDYEIKHDGDNFYLVKKKPKYPETYEECCKILGYSGNYNMILTTDVDNKLFNAFYRLKVCRDVYWKVAGEEMGLGKPWKPDYTNAAEKKFAIWVDFGEIKLGGAFTTTQMVLSFPTKEMRNAFYENFKELIEMCKELL